jgi:hypothetical protein
MFQQDASLVVKRTFLEFVSPKESRDRSLSWAPTTQSCIQSSTSEVSPQADIELASGWPAPEVSKALHLSELKSLDIESMGTTEVGSETICSTGEDSGTLFSTEVASVDIAPPQFRNIQHRRRRSGPLQLATQLKDLEGEDASCVIKFRRIHRLGFESAERLSVYCGTFGMVKKVALSNHHSKVEGYEGSCRIRPSGIGFVVMERPEAARAIIAMGETQTIDGYQIGVNSFEARGSGVGHVSASNRVTAASASHRADSKFDRKLAQSSPEARCQHHDFWYQEQSSSVMMWMPLVDFSEHSVVQGEWPYPATLFAMPGDHMSRFEAVQRAKDTAARLCADRAAADV